MASLDLVTLDELEIEVPSADLIQGHGNLSQSQVEGLAQPGARADLPDLKRLSARHHAVAKMMACGYKDSETCAITGYAYPTLQVLKKSPAFQNLIQIYMEEMSERMFDFSGRLQFLTGMAYDKLQEVLEDTKNLTPEFIQKTAFGLGDRLGYGPINRSITKDVSDSVLTAADIDKIKAKIDEEESKTIPASFEVVDESV